MKLRAKSTADGRIGWPSIIEYLLTEGPRKGQRVPVPPTFESHPHPDPESLRREGKAHFKASCAYLSVIHDPEGYQKLKDAGWIDDPKHRGESLRLDERPRT